MFKSCGKNVAVADDAYIEHPEVMEVGDNVQFERGFHMIGQPRVCQIGSDVKFWPYCFIHGSPQRFIVGDTVAFHPYTYISLGSSEEACVEVGHRSHFAPHCALYGGGGLKLGPYCNIAAHTVLATVGHRHDVTDMPMALAGSNRGPITLVEDVWLGANVTVVAGVTIAKGCVVGANAVVTRDTEPMGIYMGVPARRVRDR
jgi:acetyltransferase-like isoleucine patch superfamily enzyme